MNGRTVLYEPTQPNAHLAVPLMSGTALHEACGALGHPEFDEMSEQQVRELVRGFFGPISNQVYDV